MFAVGLKREIFSTQKLFYWGPLIIKYIIKSCMILTLYFENFAMALESPFLSFANLAFLDFVTEDKD